VDQKDRRPRLVDGVEECLTLDAIAASEMANVGERVARAVQIVADGGVDPAQTHAGPLQ